MAPETLYCLIKEGKVKFTYQTEQIAEADITRYIRDGTLNTERNKIRTIYEKIRNRLRKGTPPEATQKQKIKHSSQ